MKNVVDSSGWLEYFMNGGNGNFFAPAIRDTENLIVPTIILYEVFKRVLAQTDEDNELRVAGIMSLGEVVDLSRELALNSANISLEYKLAMADSIILATARAYNATLWTQDEHFKDIDDVKYIAKK